MYIHGNNEIDKRINDVSKIANNISSMGDNSTAAGCNSRLITVLVLILILFRTATYCNVLQLEMHVRLICAVKFYLLTYLLTYLAPSP